jgi:hypothetical protein
MVSGTEVYQSSPGELKQTQPRLPESEKEEPWVIGGVKDK